MPRKEPFRPHSTKQIDAECEFSKKVRVSTTELFDVVVSVKFEGSDKEQIVHRGIVCHYSQYFQHALMGRFAEADKKSITLPKEEKDGFQAFLNWLYLGFIYPDDEELSDRPDAEKGITKYLIAYHFADAHVIPLFKNAIADVLVRKLRVLRRMPDPPSLATVLHGCPSSPQITALFADFITAEFNRYSSAYRTAEQNIQLYLPPEVRSLYPVELLFDVCTQLASIMGSGVQSTFFTDNLNLCKYHDHTDITYTETPSEDETSGEVEPPEELRSDHWSQ